MKKVLMLIVLVVAAGVGVVAVWNARDVRANNPELKAGSAPPAVDLSTLRAKAEAGDSEAAFKLAQAFVKGEYGLPNYSEAARFFQAAVDKGQVDAMVGL